MSDYSASHRADSALLTFRVGNRWYACDLVWSREILRQPHVSPADRAPPVVRGLVHLRGQILTALDLDRRLGHPPAEPPATARCIVFKTAAELLRLPRPPPGAEHAPSDLTALLVDQIGDILPAPERLLPPPPDTLTGIDTSCVAGVLPRPDGLYTVVHVATVLAPSS